MRRTKPLAIMAGADDRSRRGGERRRIGRTNPRRNERGNRMEHSGTFRNSVRRLLMLVVLGLGTFTHAQPLDGTKPLELQGDLASEMVAGIDRFLLREI